MIPSCLLGGPELKLSGKIIFVLFLSISLIGLTGCSEKEKTVASVEKKSSQTDSAKEEKKTA